MKKVFLADALTSNNNTQGAAFAGYPRIQKPYKIHLALTEPVSPRYIHINPATNLVHLMVPVIGGQEISTDNTCKAKVAIREFFDGSALLELKNYRKALALDIALLEPGDTLRMKKEARLAQIEAYIDAVAAMQYSYSDAVQAILKRRSNLYSFQLRPDIQDSLSRVVKPVFTLERKNDNQGSPLSALYNVMHSLFPKAVIAVLNPRTRLIDAVFGSLTASADFKDIQRVLEEQSLALFGLSIDFMHRSDGSAVTKEEIDELMLFDDSATVEDYMDALLGICASDVWATIPTSPFYSIPMAVPVEIKTERLSIITQFFLANLNVYCRSKGISKRNFGTKLDSYPTLSKQLVSAITQTLSEGGEVEKTICNFFNEHAHGFRLQRALTTDDITAIQQRFERTWRTVTATKENPHMDDFMILDKDVSGKTAKFVTHQGSICVNFAELVDATTDSANPGFFASIRADFATHSAEIPHKNEGIPAEIDIEPQVVIKRLTPGQYETLPLEVKKACSAHPPLQDDQFLQAVAEGKQTDVETLLTTKADNTQRLLQAPGLFTDYSGRTFNCTAYEYAYWAKDTHMCRMLERYMDEDTKAQMLELIDKIEGINATTRHTQGLEYLKHGKVHHSAHFSFTPLIKALTHYVEGYPKWFAANDRDSITEAWLKVGKAQRNVPAHVAQEYCRKGRSFENAYWFNEKSLPRRLTLRNDSNQDNLWFPLQASKSGLGFNFTIIRGCWTVAWGGMERSMAGTMEANDDLRALTRLNVVRTADLEQSYENLNPPATSHRMTM